MNGRTLRLVLLVGWGLLGSSLPSRAGTPISSIPPGGLVLSTPHAYYVVTQNLTYVGTAITITADDVTLDLSSRTLSNPSGSGGAGVWVSGANRVWIRNGTITRFSDGIALTNARGTRIDQVRAIRNDRGIVLSSSNENTIQDSRADGNDAGIWLTDSHWNTIRFSSISANGHPGIQGRGNDNTFLYNTINGNENGLTLRGSRNTIQNNTALYNNLVAIELLGGDNNTVRNNIVSGWYRGMSIDGSNTTVQNNTSTTGSPSGTAIEIKGFGQQVYGNTANAAASGGWVGIVVRNGSTGNTLTYNRALVNGGTDLVDENPNCDSNLWERNYFVTRSQDCIH